MNFCLKKKAERWFSPIDRSLRRELKPAFDFYWFDTTSYKELVDLRIKYKNGALQIFFSKAKNCSFVRSYFCLMDNVAWNSINFDCYGFFKKSNSPNC